MNDVPASAVENRVDIKMWNVRRAPLRDVRAGVMARWVHDQEFDLALLKAAVVNQARKHRKCPPEEMRKLISARRSRAWSAAPPSQVCQSP